MRSSLNFRRLGTAAVLATALAASASLAACDTVAGAGQDVSHAGNAVTNSAQGAKNGN